MNGQQRSISIITINLNNRDGLIKTIDSVLAQTYKNFQYIIIDGASTDGSIDVIEKHAGKIGYWVSEQDRGIYHAQNKGIGKSSGNYLLFLNSGDYLFNETVLEDILKNDFNEDILYGDIYFDTGNTEFTFKTYPSKLTFDYFFTYSESLPHPATLIKKSLFERVGIYNEEFKIVSDWEFWLKAIFLHQASYKKISLPISVCDTDGLSLRPEFKHVMKQEMEKVYNNYFPGIVDDYKKFNAFKSEINNNMYIKILKKFNLINRIIW